MKLAPFLRLFLFIGLGLSVIASHARAADAQPSAQEARLQQMLRDPVAVDPTSQLYFGEAMSAMGRRAQGDVLRGALVGLWLRRVEGEAADPALTLGALLSQSPAASPFVADSPLAQAWAGAIHAHVRLRALDERAAADLHPPADAPGALQPMAPGLWATPAPVGPMLLYVTAHQGLATPLLLARLHAQVIDKRLDCLPARGVAVREEDAVFACEGNLRAASLPALRKALASSAGRELPFGADAGEFDSSGTIAAWIDALAAGHEAELKRLLTRAAPCETAPEPARRCAWGGDAAPATMQAAAPGAQHRVEPDGARESPAVPRLHLMLQGLGRYMNWLLGGAIVCWLICRVLASSSLVVEVIVHVLVVHGLLFLTWVGMIVFLMTWGRRFGEMGIADAVFWGSQFMALASGIVVGGVLHFVMRLVEWMRDNGR